MQRMSARPLADLTLDDLDSCPIWRVEDRDSVEFAVAVDDPEIPEAPDDLLIARTRFRFANGRSFVGFAASGDWGGADFVPPVIIHEGRHLPLADEEGRPLGHWSSLGPTPEQVFPVTAESEVRVGGKRVSRRYGADGGDPDRKPPGFWHRVQDFLDRHLGPSSH